MLSSFEGKRVFITGHTGFKGAWLTFILKEFGAEILGYALPPAADPSHFELLNLRGAIQHVVGDVRDSALLTDTLRSFRPEYVFHLAAQALVRQSYVEPVETFATNVIGSVHLLEAVRLCESVRSLVCATSDKCYQNFEWEWGYRENDRLGGRDPYSASKAAAELAFAAYADSYYSARPSLGAATVRAGNVIGGGDWSADRIVPDCIRAIASKSPICLRSPHATRPWQHVLDPLFGYLFLAQRLREEPQKYAGAWNFGPSTDDVRTVHDVARAIVEVLGEGRIVLGESSREQHEARLLQLNCDKAHQLLGWRPHWRVDKSVLATAQWYKCVAAGADAGATTRAQLLDFLEEAS